MKTKFTRILCLTLLVIAQTISLSRPVAAEIIQNTRETAYFTYYDNCADEEISAEVEVHLIWILNDGKVDSIHTNVTGTAVGLTTGNSYIYKNNYKDDFLDYTCGGTATAQAHIRVIGKGKAPNSQGVFSIRYDFDSNCNELSPVVTVLDYSCK